MAKTSTPDSMRPPGEGPAYGVISVLLFAHLFCILVALGGNWSRSLLEDRLLGALRPYLQLLNFDPNMTPYHLTHATIEDVDHRLEWLPRGAEPDAEEAWVVEPTGSLRAADSHKRYQRFAKTIAVLTEQENEDMTAELARSAGAHALVQRKITPEQIRVRRHLLQTWNASAGRGPGPRDPNAAAYFNTAYAANVLSDEAGNVDVIKISGRSETALPTQDGAGSDP